MVIDFAIKLSIRVVGVMDLQKIPNKEEK